ncbi:MAG: hypothetical protein RL582_1410 [Bacteroidota bacterium]|jgi:hypothetical protein
MKKITASIFVFFLVLQSFANEGMWLPQLLQTLNEKEMKKMGMKISAEDIYSISKSSLKDAIVSFGGFCTAEVISNQGLILTNHHCGFDAIQNQSSLEKNYIQNGFWAMQKGQELPNAGLFATFIIRIEDVSDKVLNGVTRSMSEKERQSAIDKNMATLKKDFPKESDQDILIRSFFDGNKYFLFVTETYRDVRLVGAPPASIGNFGKDTDNWKWPRHTGDFSMFRIYAGKNNRPAAYSTDNVPYQPKRALNISLKGMKEGDFTMVMGFPGRTNEYLSAAAVKQILAINDPAKIKIRHEVLSILGSYMRKDEKIKIQYAAKYASIENAYKKWQGEVLGLTKSNAVKKKLEAEKLFMEKVKSDKLWDSLYGTVLDDLQTAYGDIEPLLLARDYYNETMPRIELFNIAGTLSSYIKAAMKDNSKANPTTVIQKLDEIYSEYNKEVDQTLMASLLEMYMKDIAEENIPVRLNELLREHKNMKGVVAHIYQRTGLNSKDSITDLLQYAPDLVNDILKRDPAYQLYMDIATAYAKSTGDFIAEMQSDINKLQRTYMESQMAVLSDNRFYPDANSTLRVTYGNVKGYKPRDAVKYEFYTYMDGLMEKYKPGDYEFDLPKKLIDLYETKDFGPYGVNGKQPVCFIASNHTTGGNSGSPALDAKGNLIGLNFDRVWEGTMSDINYDPEICRNIMVDIRYVLFIVDKFAGAKHLVDEMNLVN